MLCGLQPAATAERWEAHVLSAVGHRVQICERLLSRNHLPQDHTEAMNIYSARQRHTCLSNINGLELQARLFSDSSCNLPAEKV